MMHADLLSVMEAVREDRTVRGITLRGKNGVFCSGGDLKSFNAMQAPGVSHADVAKMNRGIGDVLIAHLDSRTAFCRGRNFDVKKGPDHNSRQFLQLGFPAPKELWFSGPASRARPRLQSQTLRAKPQRKP